ncbi:MAG: ATP-binding protein, partial [Acidobacteria bacterium]|nr:ATP-binding protein [Acidobacteriota bacterium]
MLKIKTESKNLDYKQSLNWEKCSKGEKLEIVKDILAMFNTQDGGRIVFGVRDNDFEFLGLSDDEFTSFDQTRVNDFLHNYTDPQTSCQVYKETVAGKRVVVVDVPEFTDTPVVCKQDAHSSKDNSKLILRRGQIYIRTEKGSSEGISTAQQMRELLGRALVKRGDELLHNIERLIRGRPPKREEKSEDKYQEEIGEVTKFYMDTIEGAIGNHGSWTICARPIEYDPKRIADHKAIRDLIAKSEVHLRGWNFPHTDRDNATNFQKGRQSFTIWEEHIEAYRAYQSGLFVWKMVFWEDASGKSAPDTPVLSFISAIWSITEFTLFMKRYYEELLSDGDLRLDIALIGTSGRRLVSFKPEVSLRQNYVSKEGTIRLQEDMQVVE